jgi:hypothetical protein
MLPSVDSDPDWIHDHELGLIQCNIQHDVWIPVNVIRAMATLLRLLGPLPEARHVHLTLIAQACSQIIDQALRNDLIAFGYQLTRQCHYQPPIAFEDEQAIPQLGPWAERLSFEQILIRIAQMIDTQIGHIRTAVDGYVAVDAQNLSDEQQDICTSMRTHCHTAQAASRALILDAFVGWLHQHQLATRIVHITLPGSDQAGST